MFDGFEWNNDKATLNLKKHGFFEEALTVFWDERKPTRSCGNAL